MEGASIFLNNGKCPNHFYKLYRQLEMSSKVHTLLKNLFSSLPFKWMMAVWVEQCVGVLSGPWPYPDLVWVSIKMSSFCLFCLLPEREKHCKNNLLNAYLII